MARAILGRMRAVRIEDTRLTLWLSNTILPDMAATPLLDTSTILPVFSSLATRSKIVESKSKMAVRESSVQQADLPENWRLAPMRESRREPRRPPIPPIWGDKREGCSST